MSKVVAQRLELLSREMLRAAGFKPAHLREAYQATRDAVKADKVLITPKGDALEVPDHRIRLSGADQMYRMTGMYPSEHEQANGGRGVVVEVQLLTPDGGRTVVRVGAGTPDVVTQAQQDEP